MILGILFVLVGLGLVSGAGWARWTAIFILVLNLLEQLAWLGNSSYPSVDVDGDHARNHRALRAHGSLA